MELKTLKELERFGEVHYEGSSMISEHDKGEYIKYEDARVEAKNWINSLVIQNRQYGRTKSTLFSTTAQIDWIKYFFNITAEDLK